MVSQGVEPPAVGQVTARKQLVSATIRLPKSAAPDKPAPAKKSSSRSRSSGTTLAAMKLTVPRARPDRLDTNDCGQAVDWAYTASTHSARLIKALKDAEPIENLHQHWAWQFSALPNLWTLAQTWVHHADMDSSLHFQHAALSRLAVPGGGSGALAGRQPDTEFQMVKGQDGKHYQVVDCPVPDVCPSPDAASVAMSRAPSGASAVSRHSAAAAGASAAPLSTFSPAFVQQPPMVRASWMRDFTDEQVRCVRRFARTVTFKLAGAQDVVRLGERQHLDLACPRTEPARVNKLRRLALPLELRLEDVSPVLCPCCIKNMRRAAQGFAENLDNTMTGSVRARVLGRLTALEQSFDEFGDAAALASLLEAHSVSLDSADAIVPCSAANPKTVAAVQRQLLRVGYVAPTSTVTHPAPKGRCLVAAAPIAAGDFVCEYAGQLLCNAQAERRESAYTSVGCGCYMFYFTWRGALHCVDATAELPENGVGRLLAHSRQNPSLKSHMVLVNGRPRLALTATRDIATGEELSYDYGERNRAIASAFPWLNQS